MASTIPSMHHAYMREALGINVEEEFKQGRLYMVLEYSLCFRKSLQKRAIA